MFKYLLLSLVLSSPVYAVVSGEVISAQNFNNSSFQIGDVKTSVLTESTFQSLHGNCWVLMDGRDISGKALAPHVLNNKIPDARGMVLRGKNNGRIDNKQNPEGDLAIGSYQADSTKRPTIPFTGLTSTNGSHAHTFWRGGLVAGGGYPSGTNNGAGPQTTSTEGSHNHSLSIDGGGDAETRMKNITVNYFIKIDSSCN